MNLIDTLKVIRADARPEMSPELSWAIITLFSVIIVWVTVRYINRLDTMIERIDTAIELINKTLISHDKTIEIHEKEITHLKEANKAKRR